MAASSLADASRRNLFALAGLVVGTAAIIAILTLSLVVRAEALRQFADSEFDVVVVKRSGATQPDGARRPARLSLELAEGLIQSVPALVRVAPVLEHRGSFTFEGKTFSATIHGLTEAFFDLNRLQTQGGRTLSDLDRFQPYAVLGSGQAAALAEGGDPTALVGRQIVVEGRVTSIIGVLAPSDSSSPAGVSVNTGLLLPATTFTRVLPSIEISAVFAEARRIGTTEAVIDDIRAFFRTHAEGLGLQISSADQELAAMRRQLRLMTVFLGVAGSLAFVLGGASMLNGMLATVTERRREIGLRRALGASRGDIRAQFLYEALLLSLGGALIGCALGLAAATAIAHFAGWSLLISPLVLILGVLVTVATGAAAGGIPAWQAARLDPIQAMLSTD